MTCANNNLFLGLIMAVGCLMSQGCSNPTNNTPSTMSNQDGLVHLTSSDSDAMRTPSQPNAKSFGAYSLRQDDNLLLNSINQAINDYIENTIRDPQPVYGYEDIVESNADATAVVETSRASESTESAQSNYSQTNLIEQGVDEADFVKQNKNYIFLYGNKDSNKAIRIYDKSDFETHQNNQSQPAPVSEIKVYPDKKVDGLFLDNDKLYTLNVSDRPQDYHYPGYIKLDYNADFAEVDSYDINNIQAPKLTSSIKMKGHYQQSRKIDDSIFLIMQNGIDLNLSIECDNDMSYDERMQKWQDEPEASIKQCQQKYSLTEQELVKRMPQDVNGTPINPNDCYVPKNNDGSTPLLPTLTNLTLINTIDLQQGNHQTSCVVSSADGFYMNDKAMYFANAEYEQPQRDNWLAKGISQLVGGDSIDFPTTHTIIHKFALDDNDDMEYTGTGRVDGLINFEVPSFSMNEYEGILRIVTSSEGNNGVKNMLHTLEESEDTLELITLATLPNKQNPKSIGKPDERIKGVRFMGNQGYVVTFLNADPLYKIDLSNPSNPKMMGELEMPGYSAYLHKLNEDYVMGIGYTVNERAQPTGIQTTLFDVTEVPKIVSQDTVVIKDGNFNPNFQLMVDTDSKALSTIYDEGVFKVTIPYFQELQQRESQGKLLTQTKALEYEIDLDTAEFANRYRRDGQKLKASLYEQPRFRALIDGDKLYYSTDDGRINKYLWGQP